MHEQVSNLGLKCFIELRALWPDIAPVCIFSLFTREWALKLSLLRFDSPATWSTGLHMTACMRSACMSLEGVDDSRLAPQQQPAVRGAAASLLADPDNSALFRDVKLVGSRNVIKTEPNFKEIEVEQRGELRVRA